MPATTGPRPPKTVPIPPVTPREPEQPGGGGLPEQDTSGVSVAPRDPPAARVPAEFEKVIAELRKEIAALKARSLQPGPSKPHCLYCPELSVGTFAELVERIKEIRHDVGSLKGRNEHVLGELDTLTKMIVQRSNALTARVETLERKLTPDASGRMTGLSPIYQRRIWMKKNEKTGMMEPGKNTVDPIYLGEGMTFRLFPPREQPAGQLVAPAEPR
jgi:hypothetical protein